MTHTTIMRWVQHYTPEFEKRWHQLAIAVDRSWRVHETYVKIIRCVALSISCGGPGRSYGRIQVERQM